MTERWQRLAPGVYTRRYAELDLSIGLVVGAERCLVVDTRGSRAHGTELAAAVREVTPLPWTVLVTHAHFDHAFGTVAFGPCPVWSHAGCPGALAANGEQDRREWTDRYRAEGKVELATDLATTPIVEPTRTFTHAAQLDLGGRTVDLLHPGPGHTDHDAIAVADDVVFAGDLVEHAPGGTFTAESFGRDSDLDAWPTTLDAVLKLQPRVVVPGHGASVDTDFVVGARTQLRTLAAWRVDVRSGARTVEEAADAVDLPPDAVRAALM